MTPQMSSSFLQLYQNDPKSSLSLLCIPFFKVLFSLLGIAVICLSFQYSTNSPGDLKNQSYNFLTLSEIRYDNFSDIIMPVQFQSTFERQALEMRIDCKVKNLSYSCMSICNFEVYLMQGDITDRWECYQRIGVPPS